MCSIQIYGKFIRSCFPISSFKDYCVKFYRDSVLCNEKVAGKRKLYFVTGPPSPHLHKTIVKSILIITK